MKHSWTPERDAKLRAGIDAGLSTALVAADLGCTRNAVIGRAHRLGIRRPSNVPTISVPRQPRPPRRVRIKKRSPRPRMVFVARAPTPVVVPAEAPTTRGLGIMDLTPTTCRWPQGEPGKPGFGFCGADKPIDTPYCAYHHSIAYQPTEDRKRWDRRIVRSIRR